MLLAQQYPTLAKEGLSESQIRRTLISRGYSGRIGANSNRVTEILFAANGSLSAAEKIIDENYPQAFKRSDGTSPTRERLTEQLRWERTRTDAEKALARVRSATTGEPISPPERPSPSEPASKKTWTPPMDQAWKLTEKNLGSYPYILLYGPPGTGKTGTSIRRLRQIAEERGGRVVNIYITPETTAAELMGFVAPDETGAFVKRYGPLSQAMINNWPVIINELDDAIGDAETALLGVLDDQDIAQYELMWGECIKPQPGWGVVATMNGDPEGLRPALLDRFPLRVNITNAHPDAIMRLPEELREPAYRSIGSKDPNQRYSLRSWLAFVDAMEKGNSREDAAALVWQNKAKDILNAIRMAR